MGKTKKKKNTKSLLEYVETPKKFHVKPIKCLNAKLKEFVTSIKEKEITFCTGSPGTGKTYLALWTALRLLEKGQFKKIVLVKSILTIPGEDLGILPGDMYDKIEPFLWSFLGNIDKLIGEEERKRLVGAKIIDFMPIAYIRGVNIDESIVIFDEAQNTDISTFKSIITRIGSNSKYVIMGDVEQIDLKYKGKSSLSKVVDLFEKDGTVGTIRFLPEDCVRNPLIPHLLELIKTLE